MDGWLSKITEWFISLVQGIFSALKDWFGDAVVWLLDLVLQPLASLIAGIPAPSFLTTVNLGSLLSGLPPFALYVIQNARLGEALLIIGAGVSFNLMRKLFTLGQW